MTKILLVEDDKSLREIYGVRLLAEGYDIVSAGDGEEALAMAIKEKPTLIISDVMMPKISGFDMLDILRSTTETRDIKVIMMTALSSDDQRTRGEQLGADRYLVKSQVGIEDVVRTVHEVLSDAAGAATPAPTTPTPAADAVTPSSAPEQTTVPEEPTASADNTSAMPAVEPGNEDITPIPEPAAPSAAAQSPVPAISSSYEESGPGPLPPQPDQNVTESLPQPTAPFSSPRPTNLGERVVHPLEESETSIASLSSDVSDQITKELQASAEPVANSQVDEAISDADVDPTAPAAPIIPTPSVEAKPVPTITPTPDLPTPTEIPEVPVAPTPPSSEPDNKPPVISGTSTPIS